MKCYIELTFFVCLIILLSNCTKSIDQFSNAELDPFFDSFVLEAAERGIEIDLHPMNIQGQIVDISAEHVAGRCKHSDRNPAMIIIDQEFWSSASHLHKEYVIFHELGHCVLKREHRNEAQESGACFSIMASDNKVCGINYNLDTRAEYLDELFLYNN